MDATPGLLDDLLQILILAASVGFVVLAIYWFFNKMRN